MPLNRDNLPVLQKDFPHDMADLLVATDIYDIRASIQQDYRRALTVKLPLPAMDMEDFPQEDVAVMYMTPSGWELFEVPLKFTKSAVSFDTKVLSRNFFSTFKFVAVLI